jgi:DNA polymerase III epsilon subunit-like protein
MAPSEPTNASKQSYAVSDLSTEQPKEQFLTSKANYGGARWKYTSKGNVPRSPKNRKIHWRPRPAVVSPERQDNGFCCMFMAHQFVALDCEMVGVGPGGQRSVLARVSLVDYCGNCLLDMFVRVEERVTDYRTFVSGVCADDLVSPMAMPFGECRQRVIELIRHRILVGHALENDLAVLKIDHPWYSIRDTSEYHPYMKVDQFGGLRPRRLRDLARMHLGILIQQEDRPHDSREDACAAMALYRSVQGEWDCMMDYRRRNVVVQEPLQNILPTV